MKALISLVVAAVVALGAGTAGATYYYHYYPGSCFHLPPTAGNASYAAGKLKVDNYYGLEGFCPMETESAAHHIDNLAELYIYTYQGALGWVPEGYVCARNSNGSDDNADTECTTTEPAVASGQSVNSWVYFSSTDLAGVKAAATSGWAVWATARMLRQGNVATRVVAVYSY